MAWLFRSEFVAKDLYSSMAKEEIDAKPTPATHSSSTELKAGGVLYQKGMVQNKDLQQHEHVLTGPPGCPNGA